jgi:hypothetical protein
MDLIKNIERKYQQEIKSWTWNWWWWIKGKEYLTKEAVLKK